MLRFPAYADLLFPTWPACVGRSPYGYSHASRPETASGRAGLALTMVGWLFAFCVLECRGAEPDGGSAPLPAVAMLGRRPKKQMKGDPRVFPEFTRHVAVQNFTPAARSEGEGPLKKSRQATLGGAPSQSRPAEQAGRDPRSRGASWACSMAAEPVLPQNRTIRSRQ